MKRVWVAQGLIPQPPVVGDEQAHPRHPQRLAQRFELIGLDVDAGPQGRLEQPRVGAGDAVWEPLAPGSVDVVVAGFNRWPGVSRARIEPEWSCR